MMMEYYRNADINEEDDSSRVTYTNINNIIATLGAVSIYTLGDDFPSAESSRILYTQ